MNEFIKKLIERLEERKQLHKRMITYEHKQGTVTEEYQARKAVDVLDNAISIVNQLAEEYRQCNKPTCKDCEVYDKEKHYCPKWCEVIKHTTNELAEESNNDFCEWEDTESLRKNGICYSSDGLYKPSCNNDEDDFRDWNWIRHFQFCPYCGKKIKVIGD